MGMIARMLALGYPRGDYERPSSLPSLQFAKADVFGLAERHAEVCLPRRESWIGRVVHSHGRASSPRYSHPVVARHLGRGDTGASRGEKYQTQTRHGCRDCCHGTGGSSAISSVAQEAISSSKSWTTCVIQKSAKSTQQTTHQLLQQEFVSQAHSCELDTKAFTRDDVSDHGVRPHVSHGHLKSKPDFRAHRRRVICGNEQASHA